MLLPSHACEQSSKAAAACLGSPEPFASFKGCSASAFGAGTPSAAPPEASPRKILRTCGILVINFAALHRGEGKKKKGKKKKVIGSSAIYRWQ